MYHLQCSVCLIILCYVRTLCSIKKETNYNMITSVIEILFSTIQNKPIKLLQRRFICNINCQNLETKTFIISCKIKRRTLNINMSKNNALIFLQSIPLKETILKFKLTSYFHSSSKKVIQISLSCSFSFVISKLWNDIKWIS